MLVTPSSIITVVMELLKYHVEYEGGYQGAPPLRALFIAPSPLIVSVPSLSVAVTDVLLGGAPMFQV